MKSPTISPVLEMQALEGFLGNPSLSFRKQVGCYRQEHIILEQCEQGLLEATHHVFVIFLDLCAQYRGKIEMRNFWDAAHRQ